MKEQKINQKDRRYYYLQVKEKLKEGILKEEIVRGNSLPTIREIGEKFGVSLVTVSKAINELVEEGILYARPKKGIYLSENAKKILMGEKEILNFGVTFLDVFNLKGSFLQEIAKGVMEFAGKEGISFSFIGIPGDKIERETHPSFWFNLEKKKIDGLILATRFPVEDIVYLKNKKIPFIWIDNDIPFEEINCILFDDIYGIKLALEYFEKEGIKRVGIIHFWWEEEIISAYKDYLEEKGFSTEEKFMKIGKVTNEREERKLASEYTEQLIEEKVEGIIIGGEISLAGAIEILINKKIYVGKDIKILVISHIPDLNHIPFEIVKVVYPLKEVSIKSCEMLEEVVKKGKIDEPKKIIKPYLIEK